MFTSTLAEEDILRLHGARLNDAGEQSGNEVHFDAALQGDGEAAKLTLVGVEFFYVRQNPGGDSEYSRVRFKHGFAGGFAAVIASGPGFHAEQMIGDKDVETYLTEVFADANKVLAEADAVSQGDLTPEKHKAMEAALKALVIRVFCKRASFDSWGNGQSYFNPWESLPQHKHEHGPTKGTVTI